MLSGIIDRLFLTIVIICSLYTFDFSEKIMCNDGDYLLD